MNIIQELLTFVFQHIRHFLWGNTMLCAFFAIGLSYTIQTRFFQFTHLKLWLRQTLGSMHHKTEQTDSGVVSPFQAMAAALAGSMGIGNIVGVAAALTAGGPGAILWMWVAALLGTMTKYAEIVLGFHFRFRDEQGNWVGGPMVYLKKGLHSPVLSIFFSLTCIAGSFAMGNMTQGNSMAEILSYTFHIPPILTGMAAAVLTAFVIIGGMERIGRFSAILIPFLSLLYMFACIVVTGANIGQLPHAMGLILNYAFRPASIMGGITGYSVRHALKIGVMRSVFSNEAGIGSSVIAHTSSSGKEGVEQGMWGIFEVLADMVICSMTALAVLTSGVYDIRLYSALGFQKIGTLPDGATLVTQAFSTVLGTFGQSFLTLATVLFAFATILAWSHYGEQCVVYLLGSRYIYPYKILYIIAVLLGCIMKMDTVWHLADNINALMAIPNIIALALLSEYVVKDTKTYLSRRSILDERPRMPYNKEVKNE